MGTSRGQVEDKTPKVEQVTGLEGSHTTVMGNLEIFNSNIPHPHLTHRKICSEYRQWSPEAIALDSLYTCVCVKNSNIQIHMQHRYSQQMNDSCLV